MHVPWQGRLYGPFEGIQLFGPARLHRCPIPTSDPSQSYGLFGMTIEKNPLFYWTAAHDGRVNQGDSSASSLQANPSLAG